MDADTHTNQAELEKRLQALKHRLQGTTNPASATALSDEIADVESRIRAARQP